MIRATHFVLFAGAVALASCADPESWGPEKLSEGRSIAEQEKLSRGREAYSMYCIGCHGAEGDGNGPAARFLDPKPRDFRKGKIKFAGVAAGELPRDEDLARIINHGLTGTSMPSWNLLPQDELAAIIAYVKTFTPDRKPAGATVPIPADPWVKKPEKGVEEGKRVYHGIASCMNCHPAYAPQAEIVEHMKSFDIPFSAFRPNLYGSETKDSDWGAPIRPPDFLVDPVKSGTSKEELVRVIAAGVGGTAMPSWGATLPAKQLWGLAYYVESLVAMRGSKEARDLGAALRAEPPLVAPPAPPPAPEPAAAPDTDAGAPADAGTK